MAVRIYMLTYYIIIGTHLIIYIFVALKSKTIINLFNLYRKAIGDTFGILNETLLNKIKTL